MKIQLAVLAGSASIDRFTNRLSIFNVLDDISPPTLPVVIPEATFVMILRREAGEPSKLEGTVNIKIGDVLIGRAVQEIDFEGGVTNRQVLNFQALPIFQSGDLTFELHLPSQQITALTIPVTSQSKESSETTLQSKGTTHEGSKDAAETRRG